MLSTRKIAMAVFRDRFARFDMLLGLTGDYVLDGAQRFRLAVVAAKFVFVALSALVFAEIDFR